MIEDQTGKPGFDRTKTPLSLLERLRAPICDDDAWNRLVALYLPLVQFWSGRAGVPRGEIDDVTQEVFAAIARDFVDFRRDRPGDTFLGWLRVLARHQILLYFRRNQGRFPAEGGSDAYRRIQEIAGATGVSPDGEPEEIDRVYRDVIEQVRSEFEERTWRAFWLSAVEGRQTAALVDELGMSAAAIRQAKSRVLRRVKEELGDLLP